MSKSTRAPMSEETKEKLRQAALARKQAATTSDTVPTEESPAVEHLTTQHSKKTHSEDFDALAAKHPSNTLRQIYAVKSTEMSKSEAFATAIRMLGGR